MTQGNALEKRALRRSFGRAARGYDRAAVLQQEVGARALERLQLVRIDPGLILDAGCGTVQPGQYCRPGVADAARLLEEPPAKLLLRCQMVRMTIGGERNLRRSSKQEQNHRGAKFH